jgi:hypothetical protein
MRVRAIAATAVAVIGTAVLVAVGGAVANAATTHPAPAFRQSFEAEDWAVSGGAKVVTCSACSGRHRVTHLGGRTDGNVTIAVTVPKDGYYTVTVYYLSAGTRDLMVNTKRLKGLDSGGGNTVARASVRLFLPALNGPRRATIDLGYGTGSKAVDVDRIVVSS